MRAIFFSMKYFFFSAFLALSAHAANETICSTRDISSFDPARVEDDIASRIMLNFAPMLVKPNGAPGEVVKNLAYLNGDLSIELKEDLEWQGNEHFKPTRKLNADDVVETFLRTDPELKKTQHSKFDYVPFKSKVRQYIKSIQKVSNNVVLMKFEAGSDYKKILSRPQAAIVSKEYLDQLTKKMDLGLMKTHPVFLKGTSVKYGETQKHFTIKRRDDAFNFQLGLPEQQIRAKLKIKECSQVLNVSSSLAKELAKAYSYVTVPSRSRMTMFAIINPNTREGQDPVFRKLISDVIKSAETPASIRVLEAKKLSGNSKTPSQIIKESGNSKYLGKRYLFAFTYGDSFIDSGGEFLLKKLKDAFYVTNFDMRFHLLGDGGFLKNLSHGGFHASIYSTDNLDILASCFRPSARHPLQVCGDAEELIKGNYVVPLYEFRTFDLTNKDKVSAFK